MTDKALEELLKEKARNKSFHDGYVMALKEDRYVKALEKALEAAYTAGYIQRDELPEAVVATNDDEPDTGDAHKRS